MPHENKLNDLTILGLFRSLITGVEWQLSPLGGLNAFHVKFVLELLIYVEQMSLYISPFIQLFLIIILSHILKQKVRTISKRVERVNNLLIIFTVLFRILS